MAIAPGLREKLCRALPPDRARFDEPMAAYTSFRIGGPADVIISPVGVEELQAALDWARENGVPVTVIGKGTNILVRDGGIRGAVIRIAENLSGTSFEDNVVRAGAGLPLADLSMMAGEHGLTGLEFACGIPGTVGGAVVMNAGAYGHEMRDVVASVAAVDMAGCLMTLDREGLAFGYRKSSLDTGDRIAVEAEFELARGDRDAILARMDDLQARRRAKQPLDWPSAGSVFKRPPGLYAGALIDQAGLKGARVGDAQVSEMHANFIINRGRATAADVLALIRLVQEEVHRTAGAFLEPEIRIIGEE